ncbi:hypothetical protein EV44_g3834 [Erysiphe necator]|uniref:Integrase catalytic domain-containing protein n=1 Tax=Uncinula necator TaxID=52586 RepID=A0A0B1P5G7_UNCNE|nr:hypothetical protein EV44_g3834 [Erysiphe necator]
MIRSNSRIKHCFVCQKEGCWSTKHSPRDRLEARERFAKKITGAKVFDSYLLEYEGTENINEEEIQCHENIKNDIETLILDIDKFNINESSSETFYTSIDFITSHQAQNHFRELMNRSTYHCITHDIPKSAPETGIASESFLINNRYSSKEWYGILIDTGASTNSTADIGQAKAYMREFNTTIDISTTGHFNAHFGIGSTNSVGTLSVRSPFGTIPFQFLDTDTPFLLCIQDMDKQRIYFNNLKDELVLQDGSSIPIVRVFNHPFVVWGNASINYLTDIELRQLHRRLGHPSVNRLIRTLERAGHGDPSHRNILDKITRVCEFCENYSRSPGRFKFVLKEDTYFNQSLVIDVLYIDGDPVLHVVDESTSFQAAKWLPNLSVSHTWDMLRMYWIDIYTGPPETLIHYTGTAFDSAEFRQSATALGIEIKQDPVEAAQSVGTVERYHAPLRRAYKIITDELKGQNVPKNIRLQLAVKAVNDSAGYDGIVPTLLVFGTFPRMTNSDPPSLSTAQRAKAIKMAMAEIAKLRAKRQVTDALRQCNGPHINQIHDAAIGSLVMVWRIHQKKWTGPFRLLSIERETCTVELPSGPTNFRSTVVKQLIDQASENNDKDLEPRFERQSKITPPIDDAIQNPENQQLNHPHQPRRNIPRNR